jgi:hypothetical protein
MKVSTNVHAGSQLNINYVFQYAAAYAHGVGSVALAINFATITQVNVNTPISVRA